MSKLILSPILILLGILLTIPAIVLGPLVKLLPIDVNRPWTDGVFLNTLRAYKKYDTLNWLRRLILVFKKPQVMIDYLTLLTNRQHVTCVSVRTRRIETLIAGHLVQTDHDHHRARVAAYVMNEKVESKYGQMVAVDSVVHDGNHRLAAMQEAGIETCEVIQYLDTSNMRRGWLKDLKKIKQRAV